MATSGQIKTNVDDSGYFWVKWSQTSQSTTDNKTIISWSCGVYCGQDYYNNAIKMSSVTINGSKVYSGGTYSNYKEGNHTIASGSLSIAHNSDGTKTFTISSFTGWLYASHNYSASSQSFTLTTIPRKAVATSASDFNDEQNPKIYFTNPGGFSIQPYFNVYDSNNTLVYGISRTKGTYTSPYTFSLSDTERTNLRNAANTQKSYTVYIGVYSYSGSTNMGYSSIKKTFTIVNSLPVFTTSNVTYEDTNTSVSEITGDNQKIVQNKSNLSISYTSATALKGASISNYSFKLNGVTKTSSSSGGTVNFGTIDSASDLTLTVTVTDSRGNTTTITKTISMLAYSIPTAIVTLERLNNYEDETHLTVDGSFASVDNHNSITIQYRKKQIDGEYDSFVTIQDEEETTTTCDKNYVWVFDIVVTDLFGGTYNKQFNLSKGKFPLFIDTGKNSVGINEFPKEGEALRVSGGNSMFESPIVTNQNQYFTAGNYVMNLNNSDIVGANSIWMNDTANTETEGIMFLNNSGVLSDGIDNYTYNADDWMCLRGYNSQLYFMNSLVATYAGTIGKTLWSGSWNSGTITVPRFADYTLFIIMLDGDGTNIIASKKSTFLRGIGGNSNASSTQYNYYFSASFSGETLTFTACNSINISTDYVTQKTVSAIVGVL